MGAARIGAVVRSEHSNCTMQIMLMTGERAQLSDHRRVIVRFAQHHAVKFECLVGGDPKPAGSII